MSNELVPIQPAAVPARREDAVAGEGFEDVRIRIERVEFVQPTTRTPGAKPGSFLAVDSKQEWEKLTIVPLKIFFPRALYEGPYDAENKPLCFSTDGKVPHRRAQDRKAESCKYCPFGQWGDDGVPPECAEKASIVFVARDTLLPYKLTLPRTSVKIIRDLHQHLYKKSQVLERQTGTKYNLYDFEVTLGSDLFTTRRGHYFIVNVLSIDTIGAAGEFGPFYEEFIRQRATAQQISADNAEVDDELSGD